MTAEEFEQFWASTYPDTLPIPHYFKHDYADRWFRIHSLPESKRYAESEEEWHLLLQRQNSLITDLVGENTPMLLVTGGYYSEGFIELHPIEEVESIQQFPFVLLNHIDLYQLCPEQYEPGQLFRPMFSEQEWQPHKYDKLLVDIANDELKAFLVSIAANCLIAPYDGGMDVILKDTETRDAYKEKYKEWLSPRADGL